MSKALFTARQQQIGQLVLAGLPHEEIARRLNVARSTVSVTVNRMRARLGTTDHSMAGCAKFFAALTKALKS